MDQPNTTENNTNTGLIASPYAHTPLSSKVSLYTQRAAELGIELDKPKMPIQSQRRPDTVSASDEHTNPLGERTMTNASNNNGNGNGNAIDLAQVMAALLQSQQALQNQVAAMAAQQSAPTSNTKKKEEGPYKPREVTVYAAKKKGSDGQLTDKPNGSVAIRLGRYSTISFDPTVWPEILELFENGTIREMVESVALYLKTLGTEKPQGSAEEKWTL